MKIRFFIFFVVFVSCFSFSQEDKIETAKQNAVSSMSLVDALASRIPGARKITDRRGNKNISIRGRQSFKSAGNEVIWEIDGVFFLCGDHFPCDIASLSMKKTWCQKNHKSP